MCLWKRLSNPTEIQNLGKPGQLFPNKSAGSFVSPSFWESAFSPRIFTSPAFFTPSFIPVFPAGKELILSTLKTLGFFPEIPGVPSPFPAGSFPKLLFLLQNSFLPQFRFRGIITELFPYISSFSQQIPREKYSQSTSGVHSNPGSESRNSESAFPEFFWWKIPGF